MLPYGLLFIVSKAVALFCVPAMSYVYLAAVQDWFFLGGGNCAHTFLIPPILVCLLSCLGRF